MYLDDIFFHEIFFCCNWKNIKIDFLWVLRTMMKTNWPKAALERGTLGGAIQNSWTTNEELPCKLKKGKQIESVAIAIIDKIHKSTLVICIY